MCQALQGILHASHVVLTVILSVPTAPGQSKRRSHLKN